MDNIELLKFNPWWERKNAIGEDKHIKEFETKKIKYYPNFSNAKKGIYIIRGPRQVGKTTFLKLNIKNSIDNYDPRSILYFSFDLVKDRGQAYDVIRNYLERFAPAPPRKFFLDEITGIKEWPNIIKLLVDRGDISNQDTVFISGSNALDLWHGSEMLPGRGIEGNEYYFLPCSFRTYTKLFQVDLPGISLLKYDKDFLKAHLTKLLTLNKLFFNYLETGGFMSVINEGVNELMLERYIRWIEGDIIKINRSPILAKEILGAILRKKCSQFSFEAIKKETKIGSHNTVIDYSEMLDELLITKHIEKVTIDPFEILHRKEKKAYLRDPLLFKICESWTKSNFEESCKVESVVFEHLYRLTDVYFYNDGKKEVDFVLKTNNKIIGVEVKWQNTISSFDYLKLKRFDSGFLLTRDKFEINDNIIVCPVSLFLATLDVGEFVKRRFF